MRVPPAGVAASGAALVNFGGQLGGALAPVVMGVLAQQVGFSAAFGFLLFGAGLAIVAALWSPRPAPADSRSMARLACWRVSSSESACPARRAALSSAGRRRARMASRAPSRALYIPHAQGGGDRAQHQRRVREGRQLDQPDALRERGSQLAGEARRQRRLPRAASAGDASTGKQLGERQILIELHRRAGRRRDAHGGRHRRLRGAGAGRARGAQGRQAHQQSAQGTCRGTASAWWAARRCSTCRTPRTPPPTPTSTWS